MRLHQRDLGELVRVDELSEEQVTELFDGLQGDEKTTEEKASQSVDARKLIITDPQE